MNINNEYPLKKLCDDFTYRDNLYLYNIENSRDINNSMIKIGNTIYNLGILFNLYIDNLEFRKIYVKIYGVISSMLMKYIMNE